MDNDERQVELDCIASIFPELQLDPLDSFSARIELPVRPRNIVNVTFSPSASSSNPASVGEKQMSTAAKNFESRELSYLPSLHVKISLPDGYPETIPPEINLSMNPKWLSDAKFDELLENAILLWKQASGNVAIYSILDYLYQATENAFGYCEKDMILNIPEELKISLLDFNINESQAAFNRQNFDCAICLESKKGAYCHQMLRCKHVFCVQCLQDFYANAINTGDIISVRCLAPQCMKKCKEAQALSLKPPKVKTLGPSELLQIPLQQDVVTRYVKLKHKWELESDKTTVYCPRKWCQGAARSKRHRKPMEPESEPSENEESDFEESASENLSTGKELLCVCEDCSFAFCGRCLQGWHGNFTMCVPKATGELSEEDKASLEYLKLHTTPCPTCAAPSQKSYGCNHMICFKCNTHFCYLCSAWLSPSNPYKHYNVKTTGCYMRLWELERGDADDVGIEYVGGRRVMDQNHDILVQEVAELPPIDIPDNFVPLAELRVIEVPPAPILPELEREGPLVLRINHIPQPTPVAVVPERSEAQTNRQNQRRNNAPIRPRNPVRGRNVNNLQPQAHNAHEIDGQEEMRRRWVQMFVEMALNDQEDQIDWNSDDEQDPEAWEIPFR